MNQILVAEQYCLIPWGNFTPRGTITYPNARWEWIFEPILPGTPSNLPAFILDTGARNLGGAYKVLHRNTAWAVHAYYFGGGVDDRRVTNFHEMNATLYAEWRKEGTRVTRGYFSARPELLKTADEVWAELLKSKKSGTQEKGGVKVLGMHMRGSDKTHNAGNTGFGPGQTVPAKNENRFLVRPNIYLPYVTQYLEKHPGSLAYAATDDAAFLEEIHTWPAEVLSRVVWRDIKRTRTFSRLFGHHKSEADSKTEAENAMLDILLLSKCNFLLQASSSVAEAAIFFSKDGHLAQDSIHLQYQNVPNPPAWFTAPPPPPSSSPPPSPLRGGEGRGEMRRGEEVRGESGPEDGQRKNE
jgi:hypothetical protein